MSEPQFFLTHDFTFEAAHRLPKLPATHKCSRLHGHSFRITVEIKGPRDPELGWVIDYADIRSAVKSVTAKLDHQCLNDVEGLENPTSENLALWLWQSLKPRLAFLSEICVAETCETTCRFRG